MNFLSNDDEAKDTAGFCSAEVHRKISSKKRFENIGSNNVDKTLGNTGRRK
jgi:hypothetical protein